jgi:hypothetical protein
LNPLAALFLSVLYGHNYYLQETTPTGFSIYVDKTRDASASFNFSTTPVR